MMIYRTITILIVISCSRYLLGVEGFQQSYSEAKKFLELGASRDHGPSQALLGYMYAAALLHTIRFIMRFYYEVLPRSRC